MTKSDLINELSRRQNVPVARAESIVDAIFGSIEATLCLGERIEIRGLGSFELALTSKQLLPPTPNERRTVNGPHHRMAERLERLKCPIFATIWLKRSKT